MSEADKYAIVPAGTMQPDQAERFVSANVANAPREFTVFVAYGKLFHGMHRAAAESQIMNAIMQLLAYNYQVVIEKDDPNMRLALKCKQQYRGGEAIHENTMGKQYG